MNDAEIREGFHRKKLHRHHANPCTLVLDELGLKHGRRRADIAVINGHLAGYEIKSDEDSLCRLDQQVKCYNDVFDRATIIVGTKHAEEVCSRVPEWWGIIVSSRGPRSGITFQTVRTARMNTGVDPYSVAQLLWKNEAAGILMELGASERNVRHKRAVLYDLLAKSLSIGKLRFRVRECLKARKDWRCQKLPSSGDGSSRLFAT